MTNDHRIGDRLGRIRKTPVPLTQRCKVRSKEGAPAASLGAIEHTPS